MFLHINRGQFGLCDLMHVNSVSLWCYFPEIPSPYESTLWFFWREGTWEVFLKLHYHWSFFRYRGVFGFNFIWGTMIFRLSKMFHAYRVLLGSPQPVPAPYLDKLSSVNQLLGFVAFGYLLFPYYVSLSVTCERHHSLCPSPDWLHSTDTHMAAHCLISSLLIAE